MKDMNKVMLMGRLGHDPEKRETKDGLAVVQFSLATSHRVKAKEPKGDGTIGYDEETQWHRIVAWGTQADVCSQYLKKGNTIFVEGRIKSRRYMSKDGQEKFSFEVHADEIKFVTVGSREELAQSA